MRWPGILGLAISVGLLWWTLHDVALEAVAAEVRAARWWPLLASVLAGTLTFPLRTVRWRHLLADDSATLAFRPLWHATAIGFMANNLLPARAGELARAYAARRLTGLRFTAAVGSVAVERVLDGIALVALLQVAVMLGGLGGSTGVGALTLSGIAGLALAVFGGALLVALAVVHWPDAARRLADALARRLVSPRLAGRLMDALNGLLLGLEALRSGRRLLLVTFWSVMVWGVGALSYWLGFRAFDIDVPWTGALLLQSLVAFGVAIPSSPGFFGPFEAVVRVTLALYAVPLPAAVSFAVVYHLAAFIPITALGLWSLSRAHLHLAEIRGANNTAEEDGGEAQKQPSAGAGE